ncbi:hypothetical protein AF332_16845 [Sporosarcina globispora]|uniref:Uncharacterized protein n=1 Tax=Sporosarcina globispora TaxID=1459 RepID=A0A0M0GFP0_SPOGL|nr:hypothetical protein [Sporosarcina globispora]KON88302.1 hypothetical protein AF332_16845 [Sporosarcina globispora]
MNDINIKNAIVLDNETVSDILDSYYQNAFDCAAEQDIAGFFYYFGIVRSLLEMSGKNYREDSNHVALKRIGSRVFNLDLSNI